MESERARAQALDAQDELAHFRSAFVIADPDLIYMDGNSLGRLPRQTTERMAGVVENEWGETLIGGWNAGWIDAPLRIGAKIAQILGAQPDEVLVADSTSVNLFKLTVAALQARPERKVIVTDDLNFPSDLYVLESACRLLGEGHRVEVVRAADGILGPTEQLLDAIDENTALLSLSHTVFKSGFVYDMDKLTTAAHEKGALVLWDLSHSAGSVPVALNRAGADLAVGCTYKYLNGGPGAPAFLYVRRDWQERLGNPIAGWMGRDSMFDFELNYAPAPGVRRFLTGTPPILSLSAVEPGIDMLLEAGMDRLRAKSVLQTEYLIELWERWLAPLGYRLNSPRAAAQRGSHLSLGHDEGLRIDLALIHEMKVLPDFRAPDNIRLGIAPLYTAFTDIYETVVRLRRVVTERRFEKYDVPEGMVT